MRLPACKRLPNVTPFALVNIALYFIYGREPNASRPSRGRIHAAIALLTFTAVVFRAELLLFLGPLVLQALISRSTTLFKVIGVGLLSGLFSAGRCRKLVDGMD